MNLLVDGLDPAPSDLNAQLQTAYTLGARHNVVLVIWFVRQPAAEHHFVVHIAVPKTQRLLTRDLGPSDLDSGAAGLSSAVKESAALVVRAAIQAVLSGSTIGEVQATRVDEATQPSASATAAPVPGIDSSGGIWRDTTDNARHQATPTPLEPLAAAPATRSESAAWPWSLNLEWLVPYDGAGDNRVAECALVRGQRRMKDFEAFVDGSGCLRREIGNPYGTVRLQRQQAGIGTNYMLWHSGFQMSLGVQAGAVFYERQTLQFPLGVSKPSSTYVIGTLGPAFQLRVPARGSRVQASFVLGLDFLSSSLSIVYTDLGKYQPAAQINAVQPYAALGLGLRL